MASAVLQAFLDGNSGFEASYDGIINNASTSKYPRVGKLDRDG